MPSQTLVSFTLHVPGLQTPVVTKAGEVDPELKINTIELIIFEKRVEENVKPTADFYFKEIHALSATEFTQIDSQITFRKKMSDTSKEVRVMLIANAHKLFNPENGGSNPFLLGIGEENTLEQTRQQLIWSNSGKWDIETTSIPMYGEVTLNGGINIATTLENISLTRMLARIDVNTADNVDNFELENIILVGHHNKGYIAALTDDGTIKIPDEDDLNTEWREGLDYTAGNSIYVFEAQKGESFLLLKGRYCEDESSSWYRVNFTIPKEGTWEHDTETIPVQRNYHYTFTINEVNGSGYTTPDDAIKAPAVTNMKTNLLVFWQGGYQNMVYDGRYMLGVKEDSPIIAPGEYVHDVQIYTTNPDGWKATVIDGIDWLFMTKWLESEPGKGDWTEQPPFQEDTGWANDHENTKIVLKRSYAHTTERMGTIRVTAGRLSIDIQVTQKGSEEVATELSVRLLDANGEELPYTTDNENNKKYSLHFDLYAGEISVPPKRIYAETYGAEGLVIVSDPAEWIPEIGAGGDHAAQVRYPDRDPQSDLKANPFLTPVWRQQEGGNWDGAPSYDNPPTLLAFDIEPLPGQENIDYWDYFIFNTHANSWTDQKRVSLKIYQGDWLVYSPNIDKQYYLGNVDYTFEIKSNTEWEITDIYEVIDGRVVPQSPGSLLTIKEEEGYMRTGVLGTTGANASEQKSTFLKITTAEWKEGLSGYINVEFKPTSDHTKPPKTLSFRVFEHHQDYAPGNGITPMFYIFPINLPLTRNKAEFPKWEEADDACKAIGEGWRLPSYTEFCLMYAYRPALFNEEEYRDPYATADYGMIDGWYYYHLWTLATRDGGATRVTMHASQGYSIEENPISPEIMARCVYSKWNSLTENPTFSKDKFPRSGNYYPYVDNSSPDGPIIVSQNEDGGVSSLAINTPPVNGTEISEDARLAAKFQVNNEDINKWIETEPEWKLETYNHSQAIAACNAKGDGWRLPTQRELFLVFALGGSRKDDNDIRELPGFAPMSEDQWSQNYKPLKEYYSYWTSTEMIDQVSLGFWTLGTSWGGGLGVPPNTSGDYMPPGATSPTTVGGVRCVRTVN